MRSRGVEFWSETLAEFRESGLTQSEFCRRRGLSIATFRSWLYSQRDATVCRQSISKAELPGLPRSSFLPISIVSGAVAEPIDLWLSRDLRITVRPGFDAATLRQLLIVLQAGLAEENSSC